MSVFGIDLGNLYSTVSIARRKGIDVIINEVSKRETNTFVSFGNESEGRMIGEKGADMKVRNFRNTVNNLKRLVGLKYNSPEWKREEQFCLFRHAEGEDGYVVAEVDFEGETRHFRPEQLIAMMLRQLSSYADREANADAGLKGNAIKLVDFVLSCPPYYSAFQRKLLMQAAEIAGLNCLTLVSEGTSVALAWGIFQELPEKEEDGIVTQFCDVGNSATYITTVKFWKGSMKVLSHVYDKHLGCRDFDMALADHFRGEIQTKYKMDVYEQKKARLRLIAGCEKLRYTLSANPNVSLNVECIMNDVDVSFANYHRDHFDELTNPLWKRMEDLVAKASQGIDVAKLHSIEVVGGGSYMPKVRKILSDAYNRPVSSTMNVAEAVAKGCGLIGAILSPRVRVDFQVQDSLVNDIMIGYHTAAATTPSPVSFITEINKQSTLYAHNCDFPKVYDLKFDRKGSFDLYTYYKEPCQEVQDSNGSLLLGNWTFSDLPVYKNLKGEEDPDKPVTVVVRFRLNSSGFVTVESAAVTEEYEEEVKVKKEEKKDDKKDDKEAEEEIVLKKRTRRIDVTVTTRFMHGLTSVQVEELRKAEEVMYRKDALLLETQDAKNALEAYSYEYRTKAEDGGELFDYMAEAVRTEFKKQCDQVVDWLYGEGEDVTKDDYLKKFSELRKHGDAAMSRKRLREDLPFTFKEAEASILKQMDETNRLLSGETHIEKEKLQEILKKATEAREFLKNEKLGFEKTPKDQDITVTAFQISSKASEVETFARPIFATPKPTPPKEEEKKEEAKEEKKEEEKPAAETKPSEAGMDVD
eukprot:TRINITY_DN6722_c4_g1_i1.p1 TRINITY_DN6722_c4_g1~~TRINITY_DN6722_c4_g1_i1.p1  ORF type:complete len:809 (+),score=431.42 TRINITY_DN6722_c4_g1_i1:111-2537(+)